MGAQPSMEQLGHTHLLIKFAILYGCGSWPPKTVTIVTSKITGHNHLNKYNNHEKAGNIVRITKCDTETQSE